VNSFIAGPISTVLMFVFILAGIGFIGAGAVNDSLKVPWALGGIVSLAFAAVIRVWKDFIRKSKTSGQGIDSGRT
jgi:hypothetical protein